MEVRKRVLIKSIAGICSLGAVLLSGDVQAAVPFVNNTVTMVQDNTAVQKYVSNRPAVSDRLFKSKAIENKIAKVKKMLKNAKLAWMFENCFPNTLDTTVHYRVVDGKDDTFVYTGDIHAMWLRDSSGQIYPYVKYANKDPKLKAMIKGVLNNYFKLVQIDPYANAFNDGAIEDGHWMTDMTDMKPEIHERKWEIDSLCYVIRLCYEYWKVTGDTSPFDSEFVKTMRLIVQTFKEQQRKDGVGPYKFQRKTERQLDTLNNDGLGNPVNPVGLIVSAFRPSDDATTFQFLVPSNFFAVTSLREAAEMLTSINRDTKLAVECRELANEVESALNKYAIYNHPEFGQIYAFEVDGFGNQYLMDDSNMPSLLSLPFMKAMKNTDPIYQNTRRFVWSKSNPYFFKGKAGEGIGGPHVGYNMPWHMSLLSKAFTSDNDAEIKECIKMLMDTDAGTGFMHEAFHKDDASNFTRSWFAWQNSMFGELIIKLIDEGKLDLLNSIK